MRLPSTKLYPEYYIVISKPIDFREISKKIKDEQVSLVIINKSVWLGTQIYSLMCFSNHLNFVNQYLHYMHVCVALVLIILFQYKTMDEFMSDVELLVSNACTFNEENSQIHTVMTTPSQIM